MSDLIDRQAAIDAAIEATDSWEGFCSIGQQKLIENYINSLPFAPGMDLISRRAAIDICANVIDLFREQFGAGVSVAIKESIEELPPAQLGTNLAEVGTDTISRQAAIDYFVTNVGFHDEDGYPIEDECELREIWTGYFDGIPSAQSKRGGNGYIVPKLDGVKCGCVISAEKRPYQQ